MTATLRILLLAVSLLTAAWILHKIRRCKVKQEDAAYWVCFAVILAVLGIFPQFSYWMSGVLGIQSPSNFVFLAIIFLLLEKLLSVSIQVSMLESKMEILTAELALKEEAERKEAAKEESLNNEKVMGDNGN